jgi:tripartite-type tricarboxylate transporter receptor subunit TctC
MKLRQQGLRLTRRRWIKLAGAMLALPAFARTTRAQSYPARPVRLVVGYAAGGATDITARLIAIRLSERLGQQFIVENRPGATTNIATEQVVRAPADGYTLLMSTAANAINATFFEKLNFDFVRDTAPVAGVIRMQNVLEVHPDVPARTVAGLIAYAKANPDRLIAGSAGSGSPGHVSAELFKMMTGTKMRHVPYRGIAPARADLLEPIQSGRLRALGVTTTFRSPLLPDVPTIADTVPGYEASSWYGVSAPKGMPPEIVDRLNAAINAVLAESSIVARFSTLGGVPLAGTPAEFGRLIAEETEKWGRVVRFSGAKPD